MKFSEIEHDKWESLQPYLDTAILPITGLTGFESPAVTTVVLERLRDWLDEIEQPFHGRTVTFPAFHFTVGKLQNEMLNTIIERLKEQGFKYVIAVSALSTLELEDTHFDAIIAPRDSDENPQSTQIASIIMELWQK